MCQFQISEKVWTNENLIHVLVLAWHTFYRINDYLRSSTGRTVIDHVIAFIFISTYLFVTMYSTAPKKHATDGMVSELSPILFFIFKCLFTIRRIETASNTQYLRITITAQHSV